MRWCGPEVEVEGIVSIKTGGCPEDCHFCSQSGRFETPVRAVRLDIPSLVEAARETAATGATEFCIVAAVRGPDERLMAQVREGVEGDHRQRRDQRRVLARHPHPRAGRGAARPRRPPLQPQPRDGPLALRQRRHHAHVGGALGDAAARARDGDGGLLRRDHRHGRDARAARRAGRAVRRAGPRRGAAELPRPAPGHAVRGPASRCRRWTRCGRSPRSGSRCRARSCASPAGASSRSATSARARAWSAASTRDRRQLPDDARPRPAGGPRPAGRARDAGQGARRRCERVLRRAAGNRLEEASHEPLPAPARPAALLHDLRPQAEGPGAADRLRGPSASAARDRPRAAPRAARRSRARRGRRSTLDGREVLLLCSNDYLGLAGDPRAARGRRRGRRALGRGRRRVAARVRPHGASTASSRRGSPSSRAPRRACCSAPATSPTRA